MVMMNHTNGGPMPDQAKRVAVIIDTYNEYCQNHILDGLYRAGIEANFKLITFPIVSLLTSESISTHFSYYEEVISSNGFDGVIVFTGALSEHTEMKEITKFINKINLPSVSVAGPGGSCASIQIDNESGITELIDHLIDTHNAERIACITGPMNNEEAQVRFNAYKAALTNHHLPIDDLLIVEGDFSEQAGINGIRQLINNGFNFDAVVCADDITAIGALKELKNQEIFVPDYVTVTGFDDIDEASMYSPTLSTVRQPFAELGAQAVESLQHYLNTHKKNHTVTLHTEAMIRESCGCIPEEIRLLREHSGTSTLPKKKWLTPNASEFLKRLEASINHEYKKFSRKYGDTPSYRSFLESSCSIIWNYYYETTVDESNSDQFIHSFSSILSQHGSYSHSFSFWEKVISELNAITMQLLLKNKKMAPLNKMLQEARLFFLTHTSKTKLLVEQVLKEKALAVHEACEHIMNCTNRVKLITTLTDELLELGVIDAALVLFDRDSLQANSKKFPSEAKLELLISGGKERQISTFNNSFPLKSIIPEEVGSLFYTDNYILQPLYFREIYFGHLLITIDKRNPRSLYEELRFHISANLYQEYLEQK